MEGEEGMRGALHTQTHTSTNLMGIFAYITPTLIATNTLKMM